MAVRHGKYDYPPLLAPGRHYLSLEAIKRLCVDRFKGASVTCRRNLFYSLEEFVQRFLVEAIPCNIFANGSFFTENPAPDDIDVAVVISLDVNENLTGSQRILIDEVNETDYIKGIDGVVWVEFPRGHMNFGGSLDAINVVRDFGLENSERWLKGYAVIRLRETYVGLRLYP
jgi:hypothetical protein